MSMNLVVIDNSSDSTSSPFRRCKGSLESSRANTFSSSGDVGFQQRSQGTHLNIRKIWIRKRIKTVELSFTSMGVFIGSWSPMSFYWLVCIQYH